MQQSRARKSLSFLEFRVDHPPADSAEDLLSRRLSEIQARSSFEDDRTNLSLHHASLASGLSIKKTLAVSDYATYVSERLGFELLADQTVCNVRPNSWAESVGLHDGDLVQEVQLSLFNNNKMVFNPAAQRSAPMPTSSKQVVEVSAGGMGFRRDVVSGHGHVTDVARSESGNSTSRGPGESISTMLGAFLSIGDFLSSSVAPVRSTNTKSFISLDVSGTLPLQLHHSVDINNYHGNKRRASLPKKVRASRKSVDVNDVEEQEESSETGVVPCGAPWARSNQDKRTTQQIVLDFSLLKPVDRCGVLAVKNFRPVTLRVLRGRRGDCEKIDRTTEQQHGADGTGWSGGGITTDHGSDVKPAQNKRSDPARSEVVQIREDDCESSVSLDSGCSNHEPIACILELPTSTVTSSSWGRNIFKVKEQIPVAARRRLTTSTERATTPTSMLKLEDMFRNQESKEKNYKLQLLLSRIEATILDDLHDIKLRARRELSARNKDNDRATATVRHTQRAGDTLHNSAAEHGNALVDIDKYLVKNLQPRRSARGAPFDGTH